MRIPVLMYHAIDERRSAISVPPETFEGQMQALHDGGFSVLSLGALVCCLKGGAPLPPRPVVLTFDDGLASVYTRAFPVLERYGFPATVFLVAGYCGGYNDWPSQPPGAMRSPVMTWEQARELESYGIEMAAHTFSHPRLDRTPSGELEREIVESRACIEDRLGHAVELFAYPYGRSDDPSDYLVRREYIGACTTNLGYVSEDNDPLSLARIDAYYLQHPLVYRRLSSLAASAYLGLRKPIRAVASAALRREW